MHGLRARSPDLAVVLLTGLADLDLATRALREGADHFLAKPVDLSTIDVLLLRTVLARQRARVAASHASRITAPPPFACADGPARTIAADAQRAAAAACPVIILGETGSGKGVLARWMHDHGPRARRADDRSQLRGPVARPARGRAVRAREGRLHRCGRRSPRAARAGPPRHAVPRRGRRDRSGGAGQAAEGDRGADLPPGRLGPRPAGVGADHRGDQRRPRGDGRRRTSSARTSTTASRRWS